MSSLIINGDTSGSIVLAAPAVAGSNTLTLPTLTGTVLTNKTVGTVLQVVQVTSTAQTTTTSTNTWVTTGLAASITPSSSTNKILALVTGNGYTSTTYVQILTTLFRGGTNLSTYGLSQIYSSTGSCQAPLSLTYLDSPATTSSTTYTVYFTLANAAGTATWNSQNAWGQPTTSIQLLEIAA